MRRVNGLLTLCVGGVFGAATSLVNDISSRYGEIGQHLAGTGWAALSSVLSKLIGVGWAWAALAVVIGWLATPAHAQLS